MKPKIILAGGTGFLGTYLANYFSEAGYQIIVLSRKRHTDQNGIRYLLWDGQKQGSWSKALEGAKLIINLAGKSVNCRYTAKNKALILNSRIHATKAIGTAINACQKPPECWVNAASSTIYEHTETGPANNEYTGKIGDDFSMNVCKAWEVCFNEIKTPKTRKICLRIAIVLGKHGGAMAPILRMTKLGLGGKQGNGKQYISWLHVEDLARIIQFLLAHKELEGCYNCTSPEPVSNASFMHQLRKTCKIPLGIPSPGWLLELGAIFIGTETELILKSRKVAPKRLQEAGFEFKFPNLEQAFEAIIN